jgi:hypothetical protein
MSHVLNRILVEAAIWVYIVDTIKKLTGKQV